MCLWNVDDRVPGGLLREPEAELVVDPRTKPFTASPAGGTFGVVDVEEDELDFVDNREGPARAARVLEAGLAARVESHVERLPLKGDGILAELG